VLKKTLSNSDFSIRPPKSVKLDSSNSLTLTKLAPFSKINFASILKTFLKRAVTQCFLRKFLFCLFLPICFFASPPPMIIVFGKPGSGKGTQSAILSQRLNLAHIAAGDYLHQQIREQTELGKHVADCVKRGELLPTDFIIDIFFDLFEERNFRKGCILDGFPKRVNEAEALEEFAGHDLDTIAIHIKVPDEIAWERITGCLICLSCNSSYHRTYAPPKKENLCDLCQKPLQARSDTDTTAIKRRLTVFREKILPVLDYYRKRGRLYEVDGRLPPSEISAALQKILDHDFFIETLNKKGDRSTQLFPLCILWEAAIDPLTLTN